MTINLERVLARLEELYACGAQSDGTHTRLAFTKEDIAGRERFCGYAARWGLTPRLDPAGNLIIRLEGRGGGLPAIAAGSHLDTVPDGGKYDGVLGCVGALEVLELLLESGAALEHPFEVIVFADEEGMRFGKGLLGSSAMCGADVSSFLPEDLDAQGRRRDEVLERFGVRMEHIPQAARPTGALHCFLEVHAEQGGTLEKLGKEIGIVTTIAGVRRLELTVQGTANHSGSTMMADRQDALVAASAFISAVPELVARFGQAYSVATVGYLSVTPNTMNVIPGRCVFTLEIRDQSAETLRLLEAELLQELERVCAAGGATCSARPISAYPPTPMHPAVQREIEAACLQAGVRYERLPSGAFHDALFMARAFPTGMIFVPSVGGISHSPREFSRPEDIRRGLELLLDTVLRLDRLPL